MEFSRYLPPSGGNIQTNELPIMGKIRVQIMRNFHLQLTFMGSDKLSIVKDRKIISINATH
ncbi:hypothetical protein T458_06250 [Brevibacillus panacihumi W25]|uniref:Uncharacterized protein n=1 Tax=Brevibacillus panacihumi W25 TaxID=1408254 RepID=V6MAT0_9BACL|nr:hypothetical protein T458_06250 [Brevibacillus panacihumi W25]